jgi:hypothetical protein
VGVLSSQDLGDELTLVLVTNNLVNPPAAKKPKYHKNNAAIVDEHEDAELMSGNWCLYTNWVLDCVATEVGSVDIRCSTSCTLLSFESTHINQNSWNKW